jgi:hypothetical protein
VYSLRLPPHPSLTETYVLELQSFTRPPRRDMLGGPGAMPPATATSGEDRFGVVLKRALGKILRHPAANAPPPSLAPPPTVPGVIIDRPRFHVFLHGGEGCSNHQDPILNALASLPVPFVIYVASQVRCPRNQMAYIYVPDHTGWAIRPDR